MSAVAALRLPAPGPSRMARSNRTRNRRGSGRDRSGERSRNQAAEAGARPRNGSCPGHGRQLPELCDLAPFSVFCALHLGITEDEGWAQPDPERVAQRFQLTREELDSYLREHRLTAEDLDAAEFDLESARLDMKVAPEGISRMELARTIFDEMKSLRS